MNTKENNKLIALFMGMYLHPKVHLQGWGRFRGQADPKDEIAAIVSKHTQLKYVENDAPPHWNLPEVVDGYETPYFKIGDLKYRESWDWLMPVIEKIVKISQENEPAFHRLNNIKDNLLNVHLEGTHTAVVKFIEWYNKQNQ